MALESIDAKVLKRIFIAGAKLLENKKKYVDELNVFPVPDGDTGTNMTLTILSAVKELQSIDSDDMEKVAKAISSGSLRGARGNSGVILSQLFRGFAKEIAEYDEIDSLLMANAFQRGVETAYKAVMKPKEGTILTVAKAVADKAAQLSIESDDIVFVLNEAIMYGIEVLGKTPDMLPVLKEAGVVDAGGQGLIYVLQGAYKALTSDSDEEFEEYYEEQFDVPEQKAKLDASEEIKFGYCTEFIIQTGKNVNTEYEALALRTYLETIGDSIVAVADDEIVKIHVHTNDPGLALQRALKVGSLTNIKIDNMRQQHSNRLFEEAANQQQEQQKVQEERKPYGFVAISIGEGLSEIFKSLDVDVIVEGGQTMNPSTEDVLNAINQVNADHVYVFPNNKNIILAANQAKELVEDKQVYVIPSKSIPQGIAALIRFSPDEDPEVNANEMIKGLSGIKTGQITYAVRDTHISDKEIHEGDILGIGDDEILAVEQDIELCAKALIDQLIEPDNELVTIYYGADIDEDAAQKLADYIQEKHEDCEVEVHSGGQPLYYYILSVE